MNSAPKGVEFIVNKLRNTIDSNSLITAVAGIDHKTGDFLIFPVEAISKQASSE
jgi:hypothetical protein